MLMKKLAAGVRRFTKNEDGLVTVEWIAIAAAVVVGGVALVWTLYNQLGPGPGTAIATQITATANTTQPVTLNPGG
jgi:Flp pilus assembly pilin Flp